MNKEARPADVKPIGQYKFVGFNNVLGHRITGWRPGYVEMTLDVRPDLLNSSGVVHGGVLMSLLDSACGIASSFDEAAAQRRYCLTLNFTTHFIKSVSSGQLRIVARKRGGGRSIFVCEAEVLDDAGNPLAVANGTYKYRSKVRTDGNPGDPPQPDVSAG